MNKPLKQSEYQLLIAQLDIDAIEETLGYNFKNKSLLIQALTHPDLSADKNYEKLEFRGDKIMGFVISEFIEKQTPEASPDERTHIFRGVTSNRFLHEQMALKFDLAAHIMSPVQTTVTNKTLADCVEALVCAIYDDGGFAALAPFIKTHWDAPIRRVIEENAVRKELSDYFNTHALGAPRYRRLNERDQPAYSLKVPHHPAIGQEFCVTGVGRSPRRARNHAAQ